MLVCKKITIFDYYFEGNQITNKMATDLNLRRLNGDLGMGQLQPANAKLS